MSKIVRMIGQSESYIHWGEGFPQLIRYILRWNISRQKNKTSVRFGKLRNLLQRLERTKKDEQSFCKKNVLILK